MTSLQLIDSEIQSCERYLAGCAPERRAYVQEKLAAYKLLKNEMETGYRYYAYDSYIDIITRAIHEAQENGCTSAVVGVRLKDSNSVPRIGWVCESLGHDMEIQVIDAVYPDGTYRPIERCEMWYLADTAQYILEKAGLNRYIKNHGNPS